MSVPGPAPAAAGRRAAGSHGDVLVDHHDPDPGPVPWRSVLALALDTERAVLLAVAAVRAESVVPATLRVPARLVRAVAVVAVPVLTAGA